MVHIIYIYVIFLSPFKPLKTKCPKKNTWPSTAPGAPGAPGIGKQEQTISSLGRMETPHDDLEAMAMGQNWGTLQWMIIHYTNQTSIKKKTVNLINVSKDLFIKFYKPLVSEILTHTEIWEL